MSEAEIITMCGYAENVNSISGESPSSTPSKKKDKGEREYTTTLKEVVVYRYPRVFHIYNVVEYGRRYVLIYIYRYIYIHGCIYVYIYVYTRTFIFIYMHG
jgi:hypothetical protein